MITGRLLKKFKDKPIFLNAGDSLNLTYRDDEGNEKDLGTHVFEEKQVITHTGYFEFENEFGLTEGFGGFFGNDL